MAGITGAVVVLPQGVAFAMIAGMPPVYGLYTAMMTTVIAALFGSSWQMVSGPTTALSIVVFASIGKFADPGSPAFIELALTLAFMAGGIQLALGLARMGTLVNFVSHSVVIGFTAGAALLIVTSQVKHVLGISLEKGRSFFETWVSIFTHIGETNLYVFAVGAFTLVSAIVMKRWLPRWPFLLIAMVLGSVLSLLLGGESAGIKLVGEIPGQLPPFEVPNMSGDNLRRLAPDAFAIALLGLIEAVSIARAIAVHTHQRIDGNQEFIGQGLSNLVGSFFACYPASGSFTRSGINHQAGAQTPLSAVLAALFLLLILLLVAPYTAYLPIPAMGGIILLVGYNLIDFSHIKKLIRVSRTETAVLAVTFFSTLLVELEFAIYIGVILSLIFYLQQTARPRMVEVAPDPADARRLLTNIEKKPLNTCPQLRMIRIDGSLFFGSISYISRELHRMTEAGPRHLLILGNSISFVDISGVEMLVQEARRLRAMGGGLYMVGLRQPVRDFLLHDEFYEEIGPENIFQTKQEAIEVLYGRLDKDVCAQCTARIFTECQTS